MKKSILDGNLQILLRSQGGKKQQALSCFFDTHQCQDFYPAEVVCESGTWTLEEKGAIMQPQRMFKIWATYNRLIEEEEYVNEIPKPTESRSSIRE